MIYFIGSVAIGFIYLFLIYKLVELSMGQFERKGIKDHCLKVLPSLIVIFGTSLFLGFFLPEPLNKFTRGIRLFTYFSGTGAIFFLILFLIV
ncbi:hypothetical protein PH210_05645 [Paenibacillus sp. BSR1-1]|uniref:hypothetical protein n=1 Tax=Paenibacillus sp. BSR1-1 TaxID=3020845 RepID=UPI0025AFC8B6|nr:hypothetical protein [Paenibacillus sp. BSR1-1]MDN3015692.1 hypothetical protein [Paenibacillus sp. BSR1-1]